MTRPRSTPEGRARRTGAGWASDSNCRCWKRRTSSVPDNSRSRTPKAGERCRSPSSNGARAGSTLAFESDWATYGVLRGRKLVVKTGFKDGAHFRAYPRNPEHSHARYLVQAVPATDRAAWPEIAGGVRVAQGVRKEFVLAGVDAQADVRFLSLERVRP